MRLIDADAIRLKQGFFEEVDNVPKFYDWLDEQPTVDAVPVVRCKDCRWGREACGNIECNVDLNLPSEYHGYKWFCPNGERREE